MKRVKLLDSIFFRLISWTIAIAIMVVLGLGLLVLTRFEQMNNAALRWAVDADAARLAEAYAQGGDDWLARTIDERLAVARPVGDGSIYMVADNDGNPRAGNLHQWPDLSADQGEAGPIDLGPGGEAWGRAMRLDSDTQLLVARQTSWGDLIRHQISLAFVFGGLFVVFAVGMAGYMTSRRMELRIARINEAFRDPDGGALEALHSGRRDADEIGELTRHSSAALGRLRRLVAAHRESSDQIAHELRTPLMHLDHRLYRVLQRQPDEATAQTVERARGDIREIIAMLESLLDIAASEAQRGDLAGLEPVDVSELAEKIADLYDASAEETGHHFLCEITPGVTMPGVEMQLTRLITNLLDNAFKYVPAGGTVRLIVKPGPQITVADDGPGVPEAERPHVFTRFRRGANGQSDKNGSGLGLALAQAIARRHGLELELEPSEAGARFTAAPAEAGE